MRSFEKIAYRSELVRGVPNLFVLERDRGDEKYINLVAAAKAEFLVTRDKDLLDLMQGHDSVSKQFRRQFPRVKILDPIEFLRLFRDNSLAGGTEASAP